LKEKLIAEGLGKRPKCRFEVTLENSLFARRFAEFPKAIIFDVAHNPDGFRSLLKTWRYFYPTQKPRLICGMSRDKDIDRCMCIAAKMASHIHLVRADHERLASPEEIAQSLKKSNFAEVSIEKHLEEGSRSAFSLASQKKELLLICGSFFIMKDVRKALQIEEETDE
jgi:dihydrofolate synthase/folylpolyglutamate synthase